jgi:hypothetical protein
MKHEPILSNFGVTVLQIFELEYVFFFLEKMCVCVMLCVVCARVCIGIHTDYHEHMYLN